MNEENIVLENIETNITTPTTVYGVAKDINTLLSVLTFVIIIIFLYKYLKNCFKYRGV